jgi:hypothetical protein
MKKILLLLVLALASAASAEVVLVNVAGEGSPQETAEAIMSASGDPVTLRLVFADGQVIEVSGNKADAQLFLSGGIDESEYLMRLETAPITRGPLVVPGLCEPAKGESCANAEECGCYDTQTCQPSSSSADFRGCVEETLPANAHLEDGEYVCDVGYVWNGDLSACIPPVVCPEGELEVDGVCYAGGVEESSDGGICLLFFGFILLSAPFLLIGGLILVVVAYLVLKKKK